VKPLLVLLLVDLDPREPFGEHVLTSLPGSGRPVTVGQIAKQAGLALPGKARPRPGQGRSAGSCRELDAGDVIKPSAGRSCRVHDTSAVGSDGLESVRREKKVGPCAGSGEWDLARGVASGTLRGGVEGSQLTVFAVQRVDLHGPGDVGAREDADHLAIRYHSGQRTAEDRSALQHLLQWHVGAQHESVG